MPEVSSPSVRRVQETLRAHGHPSEVVVLPQATRTAPEAAAAIGCEVAQIAKSLVFRGCESSRAILVIASGSNRVDEGRLAELVAEPVEKANASFVREQTGFAIGGVSPVGHAKPLDILVDADLLAFEEIWAAAGSPHSVFKLTPNEIVRLTGGKVVTVR